MFILPQPPYHISKEGFHIHTQSLTSLKCLPVCEKQGAWKDRRCYLLACYVRRCLCCARENDVQQGVCVSPPISTFDVDEKKKIRKGVKHIEVASSPTSPPQNPNLQSQNHHELDRWQESRRTGLISESSHIKFKKMASSTVEDIPTLDVPLALDSKKTDKQWKETTEAQITEAASADGSKAIRNINDSTE